MAENTRVFTDATQSSPSGCKKLGKHGSRKRAVRRWALENDEKNQQNSHSLFQRKYAWNEKNLLKESSDSRHTVFYRYGADGQRAVKSSEQSETLYFNTMWSWIHNRSAYNTDREIKHIYLGSERLVTRTNGAGRAGNTGTADACTYYYHSDHLGSAHLITDYRGNEYERIEYTPYGEYWIEKRAPENKTLPFKFTGKERDEETGLYYYGARYLDAKTSRWLTTDPALSDYIPMAPVNDEAKKHNENLPGMGGIYNTVNMHLYHYAGNNPVKYTDPDGNVTKEQNEERNKYQNGYAPPNKAGMDRFVAVGLFKNQGYTKTHNLTSAQNTKDDRSKWSKLDTGKINVDYRGAPETIFKGMQFIYNNETGEIVLDEINKGTFDYRSPYGHVPYFSHKSFDIDPWIEWGAGKADNKNDVLMSKDLWTKVDLILQEFEAGKIDKKAAQKRIQEVLPKPLTPPADMKGGVEK